LLLLSGIGPTEELSRHGIPLFHELAMVGRNLQDHVTSPVAIARKRNHASDPLTSRVPQNPSPMGFSKLPRALCSKEYDDLPNSTKQMLQAPTVPNTEVITVCASTQ
jgi:choline dehydrogenase-like flavoprotein